MAAHEAKCKKRSKDQNEGVRRLGIETDPEEEMEIDTSFTLEKYHQELTDKLIEGDEV